MEAVTSGKIIIMPDLSSLTKKSHQLDTLRTARTQVSLSYRELEKEKKKMTVLLRSLNTTQNRGVALSNQGNANSNCGKNYFQQSPSLAESTLSRYNSRETIMLIITNLLFPALIILRLRVI